MSKETFKEALFDVVEILTHHPLSDSGKKLVIHYFNEIKEESSFDRALCAIEKYFPESMPEEGKRPKNLMKALEKLAYEAEAWDAEQD